MNTFVLGGERRNTSNASVTSVVELVCLNPSSNSYILFVTVESNSIQCKFGVRRWDNDTDLKSKVGDGVLASGSETAYRYVRSPIIRHRGGLTLITNMSQTCPLLYLTFLSSFRFSLMQCLIQYM